MGSIVPQSSPIFDTFLNTLLASIHTYSLLKSWLIPKLTFLMRCIRPELRPLQHFDQFADVVWEGSRVQGHSFRMPSCNAPANKFWCWWWWYWLRKLKNISLFHQLNLFSNGSTRIQKFSRIFRLQKKKSQTHSFKNSAIITSKKINQKLASKMFFKKQPWSKFLQRIII